MKPILVAFLFCLSLSAQSQNKIRAVKTYDGKSSKYGMKIDGKNRWLLPPVYDDILTPDYYNSNYGGIRIFVKKDGKYGVQNLSERMDSIPLVYKKIETPGKDYIGLIFCQRMDNRWDVHHDEKVFSADDLKLIFNKADSNQFKDISTEKIYQLKRGSKFSFCMISGNIYLDTTQYEHLQITGDGFLIGKTEGVFRIFDGYALREKYHLSTAKRYDEYANVLVSGYGLLLQSVSDKKWTFGNGMTGPKNRTSSFDNAFTYKNQLLLQDGPDTLRVNYISSKHYDLEFTSLRFFNEQLTQLNHGKWIVKTRSGKYGMYDTISKKLVFDTVHTLIYPWDYTPDVVVVKKPGKAYLYNTFTNSVSEDKPLTDIIQLYAYKDDVPLFGKTTGNKWMYFSPTEYQFDTLKLYDEIKDGRSLDVYFTRQGNTWYASGKSGVRDAQVLTLQKDEVPVNYLFGRSWLIYTKQGKNKQGLKLANGQMLIHSGCEDISYAGDEISFTIDGHRTKLKLDLGKPIQIDPDNLITLHPDECPYCTFGSISRKTVIPAQTRTITQGTSVQSLQSEKFDTRTGTWTKTYSNSSGSREVVVSQGSVYSELIDCSICKGTGRSAGIYKWDGAKYMLTKRN